MGSGKSRTIQPGIVHQPMAPMVSAPVPCVQPMPMPTPMGIQAPYCVQPIPQNIGYPGAILQGPSGPNQWQRSDFSRAYSENVSQIPQQQQQQQSFPQQICYPIPVPQQQIPMPIPIPQPVPQPYPLPVPQPCPMPMPQPCPIPMPMPQPIPQPMPQPLPCPMPCPVPCSIPQTCSSHQPCPMPPPFPCPPSSFSCGPMMPIPPTPPIFGGQQQFGGSQGFQPFDQCYSTPSFNPQTNTFAVDYGRTSFTPWSTASRLTQ